MFTGLSSLRQPVKKEPTERDKQLQAYLASKYGGGDGDGQQQEAAPKKKKKKKPKAATGSAVRIVEGDISGFAEVTEAVPRPLKREEEDADDGEHTGVHFRFMQLLQGLTDQFYCSFADEEPVIANPEEAEALKLQIEKVSAAAVPRAAAARQEGRACACNRSDSQDRHYWHAIVGMDKCRKLCSSIDWYPG
jgi:hypothetical protein